MSEHRNNMKQALIAIIGRHSVFSTVDQVAQAICENLPSFQSRVVPWMLACFGPAIPMDKVERNHRFFEETAELVQSLSMSREDAHRLVDYVFDRPTGQPEQEVGGVMVTLAALCHANGFDMVDAGETELARILRPEIMEKVRIKQAAKPKHSPLPGPSA